MPAKRLEERVEAMRKKGRIQEGADADIVVFDAARIVDRATYRAPALTSTGVVHVLVAGVAVVQKGALIENATPGLPVRARIE